MRLVSAGRRLALAIALPALFVGSVDARTGGRPGDFDFYVLSLSWSPTYCRSRGERADPTQCSTGAHAFVMHGLWPQYERGFPSDCRTTGRNPTRAQVDSMLEIMPSPGLVRHEWRTHGTCSGLDPASYFALARAANAKVTIPPAFQTADRDLDTSPADVERAFIAANPRLQPSMIAVQCAGGLVSEVRICMTPDLAFRPCAEIDRRACRSSRVTLPSIDQQ
ncbi:MAG TPA: ribonuclease T2 [Hansschlegelia sp.]